MPRKRASEVRRPTSIMTMVEHAIAHRPDVPVICECDHALMAHTDECNGSPDCPCLGYRQKRVH